MKCVTAVLLIASTLPCLAQLGHHTFGGDGHDYFQQVLPIDDSSFFLLGTKGDVWSEIWFMKINSSCDVLFERTFNDPDAHLYAHRINRLSDGNLLIVGERRTGPRFSERIAFAMKISVTGEQIWYQTYSGISVLVDFLERESSLVFIGRRDDLDIVGIFLRTNKQGVESQRRSIKVDYDTWPKRLLPSYNGSMFIVGRSNDYFGNESSGIFIQRVDANGQMIWLRTDQTSFQEYDPDDDAFFVESIGALRDSDGSVWVSNPIGDTPDILLVHYDIDGNKLYESVYGDARQEEFPYTLLKMDSTLVVAGGAENGGFSLFVGENGHEIRQEFYDNEGRALRYLDVAVLKDGFLLVGMSDFGDEVSGNFNGLVTRTRADGSILPWKVNGKVQFDTNQDCAFVSAQSPVSDWSVSVHCTSSIHSANTQVYETDAHGEFYYYTDDANCTVTLLNPNPWLWKICNQDQVLSSNISNPQDTVSFFVQEADACARVEVSMTQPDLVRCDTSCALINVQNHGLEQSAPYLLRVAMDPALSIVWCSEPFVFSDGHVEIEILPIDERSVKRIEFCVSLQCDVLLGATHLITASIEPLLCEENYAGPKYVLSGRCMGKSVLFTAENTGGRTFSHSRYRIFADHILIADNLYLDLTRGGSSRTLRLPADGRTWRMELEQAPEYIGVKQVIADVEGCGTGLNGLHSVGYRNMYQSSIGDPLVSEVYIPNTTGVPNKIVECMRGVGLYNLIDSLQPFEFSVRALNTSDMPANRVQFQLSLSAGFDLSSFQVKASNGPVSLLKRTGQITATMEDVMIDPGKSAMMRFQIMPAGDILPDLGSESLFAVQGEATFDNNNPIPLAAGFVNYSKGLPITYNEYYDYPEEVLQFGGRNYDFASSISEGPDQTLFLVGESYSYSDRTSYDALAIKTNSTGQVAWLNAFDLHQNSTSFTGVVPLADGGCIAAGNYIEEGLEYYVRNTHMYIARLDQFGGLKWERKMRPVSDTLGAWTFGILKTIDNNFLVYGTAQNPGGADQFYCKLTGEGEILWIKHAEVTGSAFRPEDGIMLPDGSMIFLGTNESTVMNYDTYLEKIDSDCNLIWSKGYESENNISLEGLTLTEHGEILITGMSQWTPEPNNYTISPTFIKLDQNADFLWEKSILSDFYIYAWPRDIVRDTDSTFLIAGEVYVDTTNRWDVLLMKIDQNADLVWVKSFGSKNVEWAERLVKLTDGNIALWGFNQPRPPFYDIQALLIITDANGNLIRATIPPPQVETESASYIFPNPADAQIQILLSPFPTTMIQWQILSTDGRLLLEGQGLHDVISVDTHSLSSGSYVIRFPNSQYPPLLFVIIH